jgi:hypothetical protein
MIRLALVTVGMVSLISFNDQKQQLARCEIEAAKVYPKFIDAPSGQPLASIQLCMKAAGYDWVVGFPADRECGPTHIMLGMPDLDDTGATASPPQNQIRTLTGCVAESTRLGPNILPMAAANACARGDKRAAIHASPLHQRTDGQTYPSRRCRLRHTTGT